MFYIETGWQEAHMHGDRRVQARFPYAHATHFSRFLLRLIPVPSF